MNFKYRIKKFLQKINLWYPLWDFTEIFMTRRKINQYKQEAVRIQELSKSTSTNDDLIAIIFNSKVFNSQQNKSEILGLLDIVQQKKPQVVCEIGSAGGGTLFLFSQVSDVNTRFLSIDIRYPSKAHRLTLPLVMKENQSVTLMEADSKSRETIEQVKQWLDGASIDFLFIDGDHSYDGVSQDFEIYAPMVSPDGIIAFHDINPDHQLRYGKWTYASSGKVPFFWQDLLRENRYRCVEFIEDPKQDGKGIGVLFLQSKPSQ